MTRIPDHILQTIRERLVLSDLVGATVVLKRAGRGLEGLCPFHTEKTPSFSVNDRKGFYHCFGCGAHGDVFAWLQHARGLDFREAVAEGARMAGVELPDLSGRPLDPAAAARAREQEEKFRAAAEARRREREEAEAREREEATRTALDIWRECRATGGTPPEAYLRARAIDCPLPPSLRFHLSLPCYQIKPGWRQSRFVGRFPALVGGVQNPEGRICGVWRIYLAPDGKGGWRKADEREGVTKPKLGKGPTARGAVRLADYRTMRDGATLVIAEGIETALSAVCLGWPAWAALSTSGMRSVVLPPEIRMVIIMADNDPAGIAVANDLARRLSLEGRRVRIARASQAKADLNDLLKSFPKSGERAA